jgi:ATP-dependent Clp protease ATP-binding subunit ClpA
MTDLDLIEADFDADSLALIDAARETARSLDHGYVGTEHLLLASAQLLPEVRTALSDHGQAGPDRLATELQRMVAAHPEWSPYIADDDALAAIGVDGPAVRERARAEFGDLYTAAEPGPDLTARAATVLSGAAELARADNRLVRPIDVVNGVLADRDGVAHQLVAALGYDPAALLQA